MPDYGSLFAKQGVQECGLAYVWGANDGDRDAVLEGIAGLEGICQTGNVGADLLRQLKQFAAVGEFEVFMVGEVEFEFE